MEKRLMTGNEAVARGVWEAGAGFAAAYPGTPSTEILENLAKYDKNELIAEWAPNEKAALESSLGASIAGIRSFSAMKCVGVNASADPWVCMSYTGCTAGMVIAVADEPGQQSSGQSAQDNRSFFKYAKYPFFEPADSQAAKDMVKEAFRISEQADTPVVIRMTTRVCHTKTVVEVGERECVAPIPYVKNATKYVPVPANAPELVEHCFSKIAALREYSETCRFNVEEMHDTRIGLICSGCCYYFAKEVFGDKASYLHLGFTNPLPMEKMKNFAAKVDQLYIIEETDPLIEQAARLAGIDCHGKDILPDRGELLPDVLREKLLGVKAEPAQIDRDKIQPRPPMFCTGCPHRGLFYALAKLSQKRKLMISSDIGCYSLGFAAPFYVGDSGICMGSSISLGHGFQKAMNKIQGDYRVVSVLGDSTFLHTGIPSLIDVAYNHSNTVNIILDNRITAMTGHQQNPCTGFTAQGDPAVEVDIPAVCRAIGIRHVVTVDPNDLQATLDAVNDALDLDEPSVIVTRWPCALKKLTEEDRNEFSGAFKSRYRVEAARCVGCKACEKVGCPAVTYQPERKKAQIGSDCVGCSVCAQVCPVKAIVKE